MLVLHILTNSEKDRAESYAASVICGLFEAGITQCAIVPEATSAAAQLRKAGVEMAPHILRAGAWRRRSLLRGLAGRFKPNVIHCWTRAGARLAPAKIPAIGWLAGYDDPRRFSRCSRLVGATADIATHLIEQGAPRAGTLCIPVFSAISAAPPLDRSLLATPREAKVLLNLSPLHPASRIDFLFQSLKELPGCYLWLAGEGPLRHEIEREAAGARIIDRVRFAGRQLDRGALLRAADVAVLAAPDRPLGTVVQDSWAAGTPLVMAVDAGFAAPVANDTDGLVITDGAPQSFAQAVRRVTEGEDLRCRLVAQGYASSIGACAREAVIRQWLGLYRAVVAGG
jgi:glycosyltransferase involved in cell wall biosynthesis